jgi:hypothetical protein
MSKTKRFFWKIWLKPNLLTQEDNNDYIAEVSTVGNTKRNEDIARLIEEDGTEVRYDTLLDILNRRDRIEKRLIQEGNSVQSGNVRLAPRITGKWIGGTANFNPENNKITIDATITNDLRTGLEEVGTETLGVKNNGAYIGLVTDLFTKMTDGTITPNEEIRIDGDKIKILPEDTPAYNVFFIADDGTEHVPGRSPIENSPKKVVIRVPALPAGEYTLRIVTRFSSGTTLLRNDPRIIDFDQKLTVL